MTAPQRDAPTPLPRLVLPVVVSLMAVVVIAAEFGVPGGGFLLHGDSAIIHLQAVELLNHCWNFFVRPTTTVFMALLYAVFGPVPQQEVGLYALATAATVWFTFKVGSRMTGQPWVGVLAAAWLLLTPEYFLHSRTHLGFPFVWLALGLWLELEDRPLWAGASYALAFLSYGLFLLPLFAVMAAGSLFDLVSKAMAGDWRAGVRRVFWLGLGFVIPWLALELVWYAHTGLWFEFFRGVFGEAGNREFIEQGMRWYVPLQSVVERNGWPLALLTFTGLLGIVLPFRRDVERRVTLQLVAMLLFVLAYFMLRAELRQHVFFPRWLLPIFYPAALLGAAVAGKALLALRQATTQRVLVGVVVAATVFGLGVRLVATQQRSSSAYFEVIATMQDAAASGTPVRYWDLDYHGLALARIFGVNAAVTDTSPTTALADTQATLIWISPEVPAYYWDDVYAAVSAAKRDQYTIARYPHVDFIDSHRQQLEIWTPVERSGEFTANNNWPGYVYHYPGEGCFVARPYGYGTEFWYQVVLRKIGELTGLR